MIDRAASPAGSGGETLRTVSERRQSRVWSGPAVPEVVRQARRAVARFAAARGVSGIRLDDVQTCVSEAVTNAVMHGFRNGRGPGTVTISAQYSAAALLVVVDDDGVGFAARSDSPGLGLGLPIIRQLSDASSVGVAESGGTHVTMTFNLTGVT